MAGGLDFTKLKARKKSTPSATPKRMYKEVEQVETAKETQTDGPAQPEAKKKPAKTKPAAKKTKTVEIPPAKVGRKSWKDADVRYVRMAFDTPIGTKQKLKELLAVKFFGTYISQDEMINAALDEFIKKHTK